MPIVMKNKYEKEEKVTDDPFKELEAIMDIESDAFSVGWRKRRDALADWKKKWLADVSANITVMRPDLFDSEYKDFIMDKLTYELAQELTEETEFKQTGKKMSAKMKVIRRKPQK